MKYIRNFAEHTNYEAEMSKIPTPSVSYCRKENEIHFMPSNVIMFKVGDLNGNTNQTVTVFYYEGGSDTIPITEGDKWYVHNIPSGKSLKQFVGIKEIIDAIISAKLAKEFNSSILSKIRGNVSFIGCSTSEVTSMSKMFYTNFSLQTLNVSNFDTSNVTDMNNMFTFCSSLKTLDVSNWNVSNVSNMNGMFSHCEELQDIDVSKWNTSNVTDMSSMFYLCYSLQTLNLNGWDMTKVTDTDGMFSKCSSLNTIYMRNCSQATIDKIKAQLETDGILNNVTIITE